MVNSVKKFPLQGWLGLVLVTVFWALNWILPGLRTQWAFFPLWLGYCLTIDALVVWRTGTSLLTRNWRNYIGLFIASSPVWWLFEFANWRLQNWQYRGAESFSVFMFWVWATLNFTTVIPAVFGSAELVRSFIRKRVKLQSCVFAGEAVADWLPNVPAKPGQRRTNAETARMCKQLIC